MVMPSPGRRNRRSFASSADFATVAMPIVSNVLITGGIGPPGRFLFAVQRSSISLQPPQPGTMPTPVSTRPV